MACFLYGSFCPFNTPDSQKRIFQTNALPLVYKTFMPTLTAQARSIALIVGAAFFMVLLDGAIIVTALPVMAKDFGVRPVDLSVGISSYLLAVAVFVPLAGWLADRLGARKIFLFSIIVFSLASVLCGLAENLPQFVGARILQGLGGALMTPVGRIIVLNNTPKNALVIAMSMITWPALTAPVLGPAVGGFITTYISWQWNFYINLPIGVLVYCLARAVIPRGDVPIIRPFDWLGFALTSGALIALLYGLESFAHSWLTVLQSTLCTVLGLTLGYVAVAHLKRRDNPILNLRPFSALTFAIGTIGAGIYVRAGINAAPFLIPLYFQEIMGLTPLQAGGYLLVYFLGNLGMKTVTTRLLRLFGFRNILTLNGLLCGIFIMLCGLFSVEAHFLWVMPVLFFAGVTRSMQYTALNTMAFVDIPPQQRSSAAPLSSMLMQVSMVLGIALSAVILHASQWYADRTVVASLDFKLAFWIMGGMVCAFSFAFLRIPTDTGTEVSGYDPRKTFIPKQLLRKALRRVKER